MNSTTSLDNIPKPLWVIAMVLAFIWHWAVGLAVLAYMIGSGRIFRRRQCAAPGRWYGAEPPRDERRGWGGWQSPWGGRAPQSAPPRGFASAPPSGNAAFDEYRAETLRRLEEEQKEFLDYLERLRRAKDKAEFDQFMAERRRPPAPPADPYPQA